MFILGIETSCDETACAVVQDGKTILSNVVASQYDLHEAYGGVVPELACRRHVDLMVPLINSSLLEAGIKPEEIDLIAATYTPGLIGALLIGLNAAKATALALKKPFIGINHIEAHLYAALMSHPQEVQFPLLGAVFSGGHTSLILMHDYSRYELIGNTIDDAVGEAFDKVAKMMGLPYPGGPIIEEYAKKGDPAAFSLRGGTVKGKPLHFSFSGLKTAVLYALKGQNAPASLAEKLTETEKYDMAASFQAAAFEDIVSKTLLAAKQYNCSTVLFGGGVTNSRTLRGFFAKKAPDTLSLLWPDGALSLDNAAMIAGLAYHQYSARGGDSLLLEAVPSSLY